MTPGITTWNELGSVDGNVLLIVNSVEDEEAVDAVLDALRRMVGPTALHAIAGPSWRKKLNDYGIPDEHTLLSVDAAGEELELNHFLEGPAVSLWVAARECRVIIGSAAHSLHNEEVKEIFEQCVCLMIGDGRFLAHTLPEGYLFVFDLGCLAERLDRDRKREAYKRTCRALVDDLYGAWVAHGRVTRPEDRRFDDVSDVLGRHLQAGVLAFDEIAARPIGEVDGSEPFARLGVYFRTVLRQHDQHLADAESARLYGERAFRQMQEDHAERVQQLTEAFHRMREDHTTRVQQLTEAFHRMREDHTTRVQHLTEAHGERVEAVLVRDRIIEDLRGWHWFTQLREWLARSLKRQ